MEEQEQPENQDMADPEALPPAPVASDSVTLQSDPVRALAVVRRKRRTGDDATAAVDGGGGGTVVAASEVRPAEPKRSRLPEVDPRITVSGTPSGAPELVDIEKSIGAQLGTPGWSRLALFSLPPKDSVAPPLRFANAKVAERQRSAANELSDLALKQRAALAGFFARALVPLVEDAEARKGEIDIGTTLAAWTSMINEYNFRFGAMLDKCVFAFGRGLIELMDLQYADADPPFRWVDFVKQQTRAAAAPRQILESEFNEDSIVKASANLWQVLMTRGSPPETSRLSVAQWRAIQLTAATIGSPLIDQMILNLSCAMLCRCELSWARLVLAIAIDLPFVDIPALEGRPELPGGNDVRPMIQECIDRFSMVHAMRSMPEVNDFFHKYCWNGLTGKWVMLILGKACNVPGHRPADIASGAALVGAQFIGAIASNRQPGKDWTSMEDYIRTVGLVPQLALGKVTFPAESSVPPPSFAIKSDIENDEEQLSLAASLLRIGDALAEQPKSTVPLASSKDLQAAFSSLMGEIFAESRKNQERPAAASAPAPVAPAVQASAHDIDAY